MKRMVKTRQRRQKRIKPQAFPLVDDIKAALKLARRCGLAEFVDAGQLQRTDEAL